MKSFCSLSRFVCYFVDLILLAFAIFYEYRQLADGRCLLWIFRRPVEDPEDQNVGGGR